MVSRQHPCSQEDIDDILLGSDDSDKELDEIEPELLYDSDDDTEYVADFTELKLQGIYIGFCLDFLRFQRVS